jgi:PqqD family protein of HPr-rel-A system
VSTTWRVGLPLETRELDGETIVYCDSTGDTFKVAPLTRAILDALNRAPADLPGLSAATAKAFGADPAAVEAVVSETVEDLESLGIVERVSL